MDKKDVVLNWSAAEQGLSNYTLQRSTDGKTFSDIAVVFPIGNAGDINSYSYKDKNVRSSTGAIFIAFIT